jgi:hypothetical protein
LNLLSDPQTGTVVPLVSVDDDTVDVVAFPAAAVVPLDELDFELEPQPASANAPINAPPTHIRVVFRKKFIAGSPCAAG